MEKKENKTGAIIGTIAAIALCGLPGLCLLCPAGIAILAGQVPDPNSYYGAPLSWGWGLIPLCLSVLFIAIAVVVPVLTMRKKKPAGSTDVLPPQEPLPPVS